MRRTGGGARRRLTPTQALTLPEAIAAYTVDGARALGREAEIGSLAVGKSADFIVLDRDILAIPPEQGGGTRGLETWFMGRKAYEAQ